METYAPRDIIGYIPGPTPVPTPIYFSYLNDDIQLVMLNSGEVEKWRDKNIELLDTIAAHKKTIDDLGAKVTALTKENSKVSEKSCEYIVALFDIHQDCDSLKWAKEKAFKALAEEIMNRAHNDE